MEFFLIVSDIAEKVVGSNVPENIAASEMHNMTLLLSEAGLKFLKLFNFLITLRLTVTWFPSFNPFTQPYVTLNRLVDPYLKLFRGIFPIFFGMDLSPLLSILFLQMVEEFLKEIH
tara:strand:+ start:248 stop:595 length:348 start_codon:yes stop_codon:yes gene_type:complete